MLTREEIERRELKNLSPYAMKSRFTKGRVYKEKEPEYRSVYQRDRDRIIHSTAFRRLEYKTQVFVNHEGDYYRTRLTHTLEVSQISRSIARVMGLNEDLIETVALAHDIGHPPFGHAGEEILQELMKDHGGFDHNLQGLRVVDVLEQRYPDFPGLNLTWEVREGINKHSTAFDKSTGQSVLEPELSPLLETQVVDIADEIAYDSHDIDDGLTSGLIKEEEIGKLALWKEALKEISRIYKNLNEETKRSQVIRYLIDMQIKDLVRNSEKRIKRLGINDTEKVRRHPERIIMLSNEMMEKKIPLRKFLMERLYKHYRVVRMSDKAKRFIRELFEVYLAKPEQLPPTSQSRVKLWGAHRAICDYIAGMTDRYALEEHKKLFEPYERV